MDMKGVAELDGQIRQLEKELGALYQKRVGLVEAEIKRSQGLIGAFTGGSLTTPTAPEAPTLRAPTTKRAKRKGAKTKRARKQEVHPAAKVEIAPAEVTIAPEAPEKAPAPAKKKAAARKFKQAKQPKKRTRTPTAVVEQRILDALKEAGLFGLSQIEVSQKTGLGYQTVLQKLKKLPGIEKKGSGKEGRFCLKGSSAPGFAVGISPN